MNNGACLGGKNQTFDKVSMDGKKKEGPFFRGKHCVSRAGLNWKWEVCKEEIAQKERTGNSIERKGAGGGAIVRGVGGRVGCHGRWAVNSLRPKYRRFVRDVKKWWKLLLMLHR